VFGIELNLVNLRSAGGGADGDGAWRGLVMIIELIDPRPYIFQTPVYGSFMYTVKYVSDCLLTQANPDPHLTTPPDLRRQLPGTTRLKMS